MGKIPCAETESSERIRRHLGSSPWTVHLLIGVHLREIREPISNSYHHTHIALRRLLPGYRAENPLMFPPLSLEITLERMLGRCLSRVDYAKQIRVTRKWRVNSCTFGRHNFSGVLCVIAVAGLAIIAEVRERNVRSLGIRNNLASFLRGIKRNWPETLASGDWTQRRHFIRRERSVLFSGRGEVPISSRNMGYRERERT